MADDGRLAATLAGIRERARLAADDSPGGVALWPGALGASQEDVPCLLAAVEAVLKQADKWDASGDVGRQFAARELREAITAALAGEEAGDGDPQ